jgi:hypothetical protein
MHFAMQDVISFQATLNADPFLYLKFAEHI